MGKKKKKQNGLENLILQVKNLYIRMVYKPSKFIPRIEMKYRSLLDFNQNVAVFLFKDLILDSDLFRTSGQSGTKQ